MRNTAELIDGIEYVKDRIALMAGILANPRTVSLQKLRLIG